MGRPLRCGLYCSCTRLSFLLHEASSLARTIHPKPAAAVRTSQPWPPTSHPPTLPPAPTTISALTEDLLREIFLRLPDLPSLACAAFTCRAFLRAVRSSPPFRRRFRELHAPPVLALLIEPDMRAFVPAVSRMSDTGITAPFADLLRDDGSSEWRNDSDVPYSDGYVLFVNRNTEQSVFYNVHAQALGIYRKKSHVGAHTFLEFHTLPADREDQRPSRVVCVRHDRSRAWARVAVFSSDAMEWQVFPESGTPLLVGGRHTIGTVVSGFVYWPYEDGILALNTANFQFSRVDPPPPLTDPGSNSRFNIGQTKDGELRVVDVQECTLSVWLLTPDNGGVEKFMLHKTFPLHTSLKEITNRSVEDTVDVGSQLIIVIDGYVYLSVVYGGDPQSWFLSVCLETAEVNFLFKRTCCSSIFDPYIMAWPPSLIHNKEVSEIEVTGDSGGDNGRIGTEEASNVIFTALRSFKEALIDDDSAKFAEMDAFLLDEEINALLNKTSTLDAGLAAWRDRVLRIVARSYIKKEGMERESWWRICKGMLRRALSHCFAS